MNTRHKTADGRSGLQARDDSFSGMYNRLLDDGWPVELAWREALQRMQWLENHEQQEQNKQLEKPRDK